MGAESCLWRAQECIYLHECRHQEMRQLGNFQKIWSQPAESIADVGWDMMHTMGEDQSWPHLIWQQGFPYHSRLLQQLYTVLRDRQAEWYPNNYWNSGSQTQEPLHQIWMSWPGDQRQWSTVRPRSVPTIFRTWNFEHLKSRPSNPSANGWAKSTVKTAKSLLHKVLDSGQDPYMVILDHRNTPTQGMDSSAAQRLINQRTETLLLTTQVVTSTPLLSQQKPLKEDGRKEQWKAEARREQKPHPKRKRLGWVPAWDKGHGNHCGRGTLTVTGDTSTAH